MDWIKVEDELPEDQVDVLVWCPNVDDIGFVYIGYLYRCEGWVVNESSEYGDFKVTHWMRLPEPPKN